MFESTKCKFLNLGSKNDEIKQISSGADQYFSRALYNAISTCNCKPSKFGGFEIFNVFLFL